MPPTWACQETVPEKLVARIHVAATVSRKVFGLGPRFKAAADARPSIAPDAPAVGVPAGTMPTSAVIVRTSHPPIPQARKARSVRRGPTRRSRLHPDHVRKMRLEAR
jgi:hypothetical protein